MSQTPLFGTPPPRAGSSSQNESSLSQSRRRQKMSKMTPLRRTVAEESFAKSIAGMDLSACAPPSGYHCLQSVSHADYSDDPVAVVETLAMSEKHSDVSVNLSPNGWAALVKGRRLIVWKYQKASSNAGAGGASIRKQQMTSSCRELALPPSDLAHNARLVNVFVSSEGQMPSCIAVSPEGIIRYWPSIAHESSSIEVCASELQGQECFTLTDIQPVGSILATTTASVVLVSLEKEAAGGQQMIGVRQLKLPAGLLGGISRRVSNLFWGGNTAAAANGDSKIVRVLGESYNDDPEEKMVFILTSSGLQKWNLIRDEPDRMFYNCDLESLAREAFVKKIWPQAGASPGFRTWLLDMHFTASGISLLMAAKNPEISNFSALKHTLKFNDENEADVTASVQDSYKLLLPGSQFAYLYKNNSIVCCSAESDDLDYEIIDIMPGDTILGAVCARGHPLFYLADQFLVTVVSPYATISNQDETNATLNESHAPLSGRERLAASKLSESLNLSVSQAGLDTLTMSESKSDQLKAAFLLFCKRCIGQSQSLVDELFPPESTVSQVDSTLDQIVVAFSKDLIDDFPASDPRWMETVPVAEANLLGGPSMSLLILHQLKDKQTALDLYISFLKEVGLWKRLNAVTLRDMVMDTTLVLCEHTEKTVSAISLRSIHHEYPELMEYAMKRALSNRSGNRHRRKEGGLTSQDHFYRQISCVEDIVLGLQAVQDETVRQAMPREVVAKVMSVNKVLITIFQEAVAYREKVLSEFLPYRSATDKASTKEYIPWTSDPSPSGIRTALISQLRLTAEKVLPLMENADSRHQLCGQMVELIDLILDGYRAQLDHGCGADDKRLVAVKKMYTQDRKSLIMTLVESRFLDEGASLAEKYLEFEALVRICELTNDRPRLERYMDQFSHLRFADFVFSWHVKEGKAGKLLSETKGERLQDLGQYLASTGHSTISWLHNLHLGEYEKAANTLQLLAEAENDLVSRKKTMLSLSKLSWLASEQAGAADPALEAIEHQINVITAQEQLPSKVLDHYGFERDNMRVLSPRELIELYIGDENGDADHIDFKKALDLLEYHKPSTVEGSSIAELKLTIWAKAVLRDDWAKLDVDNPVDAVQDTVFFKLLEFCYLQGMDLSQHLPSYQELFDCALLENLSGNANFRFLLQTGYEHISRMSASAESRMES